MKHKLKIWIKRYLPAEIIGTFGSIFISTIFSFFTKNLLLIGFIATWAENIGFYGTFLVREVYKTHKIFQQSGQRYGPLALSKNIRNIFLEFGIAEVLDTLCLRPFIMYWSVRIFGNIQVGIFIGKIFADILFYVFVITSYEMRRKFIKNEFDK